MLKRTHLAIGIATTLPFVLTKDLNLICATIGIAASVAPDLDKKFHMTHRGFSHSLLATSGIYFGVNYISNRFFPMDGLAFAITLNYFSHIFADSFTKRGVPLFWPCKKNVGLKLFKLTTTRDYVVRVFVYLVIAYELVTMSQLKTLFALLIN